MRLELGEMSQAEFEEVERDVLARIREIKGDRWTALTMTHDVKITGVEVEGYEEENRG
jgi:hypothetical protein